MKKLIEYGKRQSFQPNLLSIFLNPFFFIRRALFKKIKQYAPLLQGKMMDFGCGRKPYRNLFEVQEYIGVDIAVSGHSHQESEVDVFYDGKTLPFESETFDSVFSSEVFEHIFNLEEMLPEIRRVMKPGGIALFSVPFAWAEHEIPFDFARYTSFGFRHILEKNGFKILKAEKTGHFAEALWQLWILYIFSLFQTRNRLLNTLLTLVFISPLNLLGLLVTFILPRNHDLFFNNVMLVQKNENLVKS